MNTVFHLLVSAFFRIRHIFSVRHKVAVAGLCHAAYSFSLLLSQGMPPQRGDLRGRKVPSHPSVPTPQKFWSGVGGKNNKKALQSIRERMTSDGYIHRFISPHHILVDLEDYLRNRKSYILVRGTRRRSHHCSCSV